MTTLYLDTSCLLKLFIAEPETARVAAMVGAEQRVVVSSLAKLEALVQVQARLEGGLLTRRAATAIVARFDAMLSLAPFHALAVPGDVAALAVEQVLPIGTTRHCRTLDRLHLAAMQALSIRRLLTNDDLQADAARHLGFEVLLPRP